MLQNVVSENSFWPYMALRMLHFLTYPSEISILTHIFIDCVLPLWP